MLKKNIVTSLFISMLLMPCLEAGTNDIDDLEEKTEKISKETEKNAMKIDKLTSKSMITSAIKTATGAVTAGVLAAFVYDAIKPSSINEESKRLTLDYPFFATTENNERVPMEGGSYKIINRTDKSISIEGNNNQVMLVKIGNKDED